MALAVVVILSSNVMASEGGINEDLYKEAIKYGRFIRDRYTILDFADDCDKLEMYI